MAKPSTFTRKTTQPPSGATRIEAHEKPCNTKPKRTDRLDFGSEPGISAEEILWANGTPGVELAPSGMFVEGTDLLDEEGNENDFDDVSDNTDEDSFIAAIDERRSNGMTAFCGDVEDISDEPIQINWISNLKNTVHHSYIDNDDMKAEEVPEDGDYIGSTTVPYSANRTCTGSMRKPKHCTWKNARSHQFQIGPEADERRAQRRTLYEMNMIQLLAGSAMVADYDDTEQ